MSPLLGLAAGLVVAGGVVALAARDARVVLAGLGGVLLLSPFLAAPLPDYAAVGARLCASLLGLELASLVVGRSRAVARGSSLGWRTEALAGIAAALAGWTAGASAAPILGQPATSPEAVAAGVALLVLAAVPLASTRDPFRLGTGLVLGVGGANLAWAGLAGAPSGLDQIVAGCLALGALAALAVLVRAAAPAR